MTELCYGKGLTQTFNKVLMKQTKNQKYLQFCRSKTYCVVQHRFLTEAVCFNFFTLQDPLRLLYVHCKSSSSIEWIWSKML